MPPELVDRVVTMIGDAPLRKALGYNLDVCVVKHIAPCRLPFSGKARERLSLCIKAHANKEVFVYDAAAQVLVYVAVSGYNQLLIEVTTEVVPVTTYVLADETSALWRARQGSVLRTLWCDDVKTHEVVEEAVHHDHSFSTPIPDVLRHMPRVV